MKVSTSITSKWQMTIPKAVRNAIGLKRPGRVVLTVEPQRKAFMLDQPPSLLELAGTFIPKRNRHVDVLKAREYFERHYGRP